MPKNGRRSDKAETQGLYDRVADVHNVILKLNGYRSSVAKYLRSLELAIGADSNILDAGSGTGIITLAAQDAGFTPRSLISLDLSLNSLKILSDELRNSGPALGTITCLRTPNPLIRNAAAISSRSRGTEPAPTAERKAA